jgi:hypothetical protein
VFAVGSDDMTDPEHGVVGPQRRSAIESLAIGESVITRTVKIGNLTE